VTDWFACNELVEQFAISDRGFHYGDGLFETIAIRDGEARLWPLHMDRLASGCETLNITMPAQDSLLHGAMHAVRHSGISADSCLLKIVVSAGSGARGYGRATVDTPSILFGVSPWLSPPIEFYRDGIETVLCRTRLAINSATAGLKTLNRLEQVLARSEFNASNIYEGLTMDADDDVICGTMSNVFFVKDKTILTPSLDRCGVAGVMRRHVLATLDAVGKEVVIQGVRVAELSRVSEVFVSNSQFGILPVTRCAEHAWDVGAVTREIMDIMANNGIAECRS